jgi:NADH dehydrogenase
MTISSSPPATHAYFGHADRAKAAPGLKSVDDATLIRRRLLLAFEKADACADPALRARQLTFVVVGGGPPGVELARAIAKLARRTLPPELHRAEPGKARILLLEAGPRLRSAFPDRLSAYARRTLAGMGVETGTDCPVEAVFDDRVVAGGEEIFAGAILWAAAVAASPAADWLGVPSDGGGRIETTPELTLPGAREIYIVGDLARVAGPDGAPALAAAEKQTGRYAGRAISRRLDGAEPKKPFRYRDHGSLATIDRKAAIVKLGRLELTGFPG